MAALCDFGVLSGVQIGLMSGVGSTIQSVMNQEVCDIYEGIIYKIYCEFLILKNMKI